MSGTSTCESLTRNPKIPEMARKSGCGGIGIRARLRCVWHYVLASSSLAIRIEYVKQLLTVLAVGSCFVLSGFSRKSIEYRRVRRCQNFDRTSGYLMATYPTKYCLTVDRQLCLYGHAEFIYAQRIYKNNCMWDCGH